MKRKLVVFSDGTGNSSAKIQKTNVWRLFQALDQRSGEVLVWYDDGVGTSSNRYLAALGGAIGWGLKRNVLDLYKFVCRNYKKPDEKEPAEIYGFGFSRGAFTIRVLVGMIAHEGLVTFRSEEELKRKAIGAYRHYRSQRFPSKNPIPIVFVLRRLRDLIFWAKDKIKGNLTYNEVRKETRKEKRDNVRIKFLGLWDTVEAYGMPVAELKRGIDWVLWPMQFGDKKLSPKVDRACHALSLDDERSTFHPLLWDEAEETEPGRITQVWFAGVHANVGGGYPEDQLSLVALEWMMSQAKANGLPLSEECIKLTSAQSSPYARLYDSRAGISAYYRYGPRRIPAPELDGKIIRPIVHGSVIMRMVEGSDQYAPITLPEKFWVLAPDGELLPMEGFHQPLAFDRTKRKAAAARTALKEDKVIAEEKARLQAAINKLGRPETEAVELVWDTVFWRRVFYFLTLGLTAVLVLYPWIAGFLLGLAHQTLQIIPGSGRVLSEHFNEWLAQSRGFAAPAVQAASGFIPSYAKQWADTLDRHPFEFTVVGLGVLGSMLASTILQGRIRDRARLAWNLSPRPAYHEWLKGSRKGWRNGSGVAFLSATAILIIGYYRNWSALALIEFGIVTLILLVFFVWRTATAATLSDRETSPGGPPSSFALGLARKLRTNRVLVWLYRLIFSYGFPIAFALLLLLAGVFIANRVLFDAYSSAGSFCNSTVEKEFRNIEKTGSKGGFSTDNMCWPTGLVLQEGRRYRITLTTPGDWFDATIRTDVAGFSHVSFLHSSFWLTKRWWRENWFQPIARIGEIGNDEYVLRPSEPFEKHSYCIPDGSRSAACAQCPDSLPTTRRGEKIRADSARILIACSPTPEARRVLVAELTARSSGELFLYVNDAVWPLGGGMKYYFNNNTGTGTVKVERITSGS